MNHASIHGLGLNTTAVHPTHAQLAESHAQASFDSGGYNGSAPMEGSLRQGMFAGSGPGSMDSDDVEGLIARSRATSDLGPDRSTKKTARKSST